MTVIELSDDQWNIRKREYKARISSIIIPLDINTGVALGLLSRIDSFFSEVRVEFGEVEEQKEIIEGIIYEWERTKIEGTNDMIRKKSASVAIQNYEMAGELINLYEVQRQVRSRQAYLKGVLSSLEGKQSRLITILGLLKIENNLTPFSKND
jgi:hypothetical protein